MPANNSNSSIKLISLNVERGKHLERVIPFLTEQRPDVACLQEVRQEDVPRFEQVLGRPGFFLPMDRTDADGPEALVGVGIFPSLPVSKKGSAYYAGADDPISEAHRETETGDILGEKLGVLWCDLKKEEETFRIATTHFTWSRDGIDTPRQHRDLKRMFAALDALGEFALCGDFNAPRGGNIFSELASRYTDNIPEEYDTSIDGYRHRAGFLHRMVDGLFTTDG